MNVGQFDLIAFLQSMRPILNDEARAEIDELERILAETGAASVGELAAALLREAKAQGAI